MALAIALGFMTTVGLATGITKAIGSQPAVGSTLWRWTHPLDVGVNAYGAIHYGDGKVLPGSHQSDITTTLREVQRMGGTVVRVLAPSDGVSDEETATRLDRFLTEANQYGISVIVSLINYYGPGHNPQGTDKYYSEMWEGIPYLNQRFIAADYKAEYETFVRRVVEANKDHPNIYAWEPGNELQDRNRESFLAFMQDVTRLIKQLDPNHAVADGMIEADQAAFKPGELYPFLPDVDIVTIHPGNGYRKSTPDVDWALSHGKRAIVEETGFSATDDRTDRLRTELDYWRSKGVTGFLLDGFIAKGLGDNGQGDRVLGFDDIWHTDYDRLVDLLRSSRRR